MLQLSTSSTISIPSSITPTITSSSTITITGPLGSLTRNFSHTHLFFSLDSNNSSLKVLTYLSSKKRSSLVKTVTTHIQNMINGVTKGFFLKLVAMNSFFSMELEVQNEGKVLFIKKFYNKDFIKRFEMPEGVSVRVLETSEFASGKEFLIEGIDIEKVCGIGASIRKGIKMKNKDKRYFVDGVYPMDKGFNVVEE